MRPHEDLKWTTKDGRELNVYDMGITHLYNSISMMRRNYAEMDDAVMDPPCFQGEMAQMAADHEYDRLWKEHNDLGNIIDMYQEVYDWRIANEKPETIL